MFVVASIHKFLYYVYNSRLWYIRLSSYSSRTIAISHISTISLRTSSGKDLPLRIKGLLDLFIFHIFILPAKLRTWFTIWIGMFIINLGTSTPRSQICNCRGQSFVKSTVRSHFAPGWEIFNCLAFMSLSHVGVFAYFFPKCLIPTYCPASPPGGLTLIGALYY